MSFKETSRLTRSRKEAPQRNLEGWLKYGEERYHKAYTGAGKQYTLTVLGVVHKLRSSLDGGLMHSMRRTW